MTGVVYNCHALHFRAKPSMTGKIIGYLRPGDKLDIIGSSGVYYNVVFKGKTGWAGAKYIEPHNPIIEAKDGVIVGVSRAANIHAEPSQESNVIGKIPKGASCKFYEIANDKYTRVEYNGIEGFAWTAFIMLAGAPVKPVEYKQGDSRWKNYPYTSCGNKAQTIKSSGCGIVCAAMILATWIANEITPPDMAKLAVESGHRTKSSGTAWAFFPFLAKWCGLKCKQYSGKYGFNPAIKALHAGALVVCSMGPCWFTTGGHYILAWTEDGKNIIVNNPAAGSSRDKGAYDVFKKECRAYFIFTK